MHPESLLSVCVNEIPYKRAIASYDKAIKLDPNYANAYNNRGLAYYHEKDYKKAMADFNKAIELNPDFARAYNNRAYVYYQLKDVNKAKEDVQRAQDLKLTVDAELLENLHQVAVKKN